MINISVTVFSCHFTTMCHALSVASTRVSVLVCDHVIWRMHVLCVHMTERPSGAFRRYVPTGPLTERPSGAFRGHVPTGPLWCPLLREWMPKTALSQMQLNAPPAQQTSRKTKWRYIEVMSAGTERQFIYSVCVFNILRSIVLSIIRRFI